MPISYKNKIYTTLGTPTSLSGNVVSTTDNAGVPAKDYTVKGKTIVWNQLLDKSKFTGGQTFNGITSVNNGDGSFTLSGTSTGYYQYVLFNPISLPVDSSHKYLLKGCPAGGQWAKKWGLSGLNTDESTDVGEGVIITGTTSISPIMYVWSPAGAVSNLIFKPQLFDLTQIFGAGNEPATPSEFRAMFPDDYYPYNVGELKTIVPTSVEASSVERFQMLDKKKYPATGVFDGVTYTNNGDGTITLNGTATATTNYNLQSGISVSVNHKYFCYYPNIVTGIGVYVLLYTVESDVFDNRYPHNSNYIVTALKNYDKVFFQIKVNSGQAVTNLIAKPQMFDMTQMFGAGNEPATPAEFWQRVPEKLYGYNPSAYKSVNIPSSKYFPDGMRSAGSAYDEINFLSQKAIKRIGAVDMGTLDWFYVSDSNQRFFANIQTIKPIVTTAKPNIISDKYTPSIYNAIYYHYADKIIGVYPKESGHRIAVYDSSFTDAAAFKSAMSGVMLYYELDTPIETAITPPLQVLSTFKGFTSFSAPNSLTQNGPLSVTYYAEGGTNPEKGWLTSYKRKLYMGRSIEWNQLLDKSKFLASTTLAGVNIKNNGDGTYTLNGTYTSSGTKWFGIYYDNDLSIAKRLYGHKVLYGFNLSVNSGPKNAPYGMSYEINNTVLNGTQFYGNNSCVISQTLNAVSPSDITQSAFYIVFRAPSSGTAVYKDVVMCPQLFDLTQMFGAGNEPATPEEFWSYFDHKLYPYNTGETQPLFKISRKSQCGSTSLYDYTFDETTGVLTLNRALYSQSGDELTIL